MGMLLVMKGCVYLLPFFFIHIRSSSSSPYKHYFIESDKLCTKSLAPKKIEIGQDDQSGAIVEKIDFANTLSDKNYNCKFKVESTFDMGLFAVIQRLKLRRNATTGECIDYVQFRQANPFTLGILDLSVEKLSTYWGDKHCGEVNALEIDLYSIDPTDPKRLLPHAFVDTKGKIEVRVVISNETVVPGTQFDLKIAFTAYHPCKFNYGNKYKKCGADACIWHEFFNDEILNCPFTNCADEGGCQIYYESNGIRPSTGLATKVMVGAVAGVFTMFVVFVMFLWIFRHCNLCWNDTPQTAQNTTQMRPVPTMEEIQPTAPPRSPSMDKDLPPSYESLFPSA